MIGLWTLYWGIGYRWEQNPIYDTEIFSISCLSQSLPQSAKLSEVSPPPQALSRIPRPRQLKTFHLPPSLDDGTGVVTSPRDNTSPADSATTTPRSRHTGTPLSELDSTTTTPRSRQIGTSLSELDSAATTPRSKRTGTPLSELDRKWALQQCEVINYRLSAANLKKHVLIRGFLTKGWIQWILLKHGGLFITWFYMPMNLALCLCCGIRDKYWWLMAVSEKRRQHWVWEWAQSSVCHQAMSTKARWHI